MIPIKNCKHKKSLLGLLKSGKRQWYHICKRVYVGDEMLDKNEKLPKSKHKLGYTNEELDSICKRLGIDKGKFNKAFGTNTCAVVKGVILFYKCDIERALWILGSPAGKYHEWD